MRKVGMAIVYAATCGGVPVSAYAGALDNYPQSYSILFESGTVIQGTTSYLAPDVSGNVGIPGFGDTGNVGINYTLGSLGFKTDLSNELSFSMLADRPYFADMEFGKFAAGSVTSRFEGDELSAMLRYKLNDRWSVYGGLRAVRFSGKGDTLGVVYDMDDDVGYGYALGVAYEIAEFGAIGRLTYKSSIDMSPAGSGMSKEPAGVFPVTGDIEFEFPQSVTFEAIAPVSQKTFVFGSVIWSDWSETKIRPGQNAGSNFSVTNYDDTWVSKLGVGQFVAEDLILTGNVSYDTGSDQTAGLQTVYSDIMSYSVGLTYLEEKARISGVITYADIGDTKGNNANLGGAPVSYSGNSAWTARLEYLYRF